MSGEILVARDGDIATVTLSNPGRLNALSAAMWIGRFIFVIPLLALAGTMVKKKVVPASAGTFPTDTPLFTGLLIGVILIVGALTFFPALALGPILEHLQLHAGQLAH